MWGSPLSPRNSRSTPPNPGVLRSAEAGVLYLVSTPIGNLGDMTFRAVEILSSAALIVAEDTRHSRHLLNHFKISAPLRAYHEHNEARETPRLVQRMLAGESVALISDAGTPLLSDPGARLVAAAVAAGIRVVPVPGASSILAAAVGAGLPLDRFLFLGFLSRKGSARAAELRRIAESDSTVLIFEAANRLQATLADLASSGMGARRGVIARELTKQFEEYRRGTVAELAAQYEVSVPRGEVVIVIEGKGGEREPEEDIERVAQKLTLAGGSPREVMQCLVSEHGAPRNLAYRLAHSLPETAGNVKESRAAAATEPRKRVTKKDEQES